MGQGIEIVSINTVINVVCLEIKASADEIQNLFVSYLFGLKMYNNVMYIT